MIAEAACDSKSRRVSRPRGFPGRLGIELVRIAEASWSAGTAQAARDPRLHETLRLCGIPRPVELPKPVELVLPIIIYLCAVLSR